MSPHQGTARIIDLAPVVIHHFGKDGVVHGERIVTLDDGHVRQRVTGFCQQLLHGERGSFRHERGVCPRLGLGHKLNDDLGPRAEFPRTEPGAPRPPLRGCFDTPSQEWGDELHARREGLERWSDELKRRGGELRRQEAKTSGR